jgi:hypothetical protein
MSLHLSLAMVRKSLCPMGRGVVRSHLSSGRFLQHLEIIGRRERIERRAEAVQRTALRRNKAPWLLTGLLIRTLKQPKYHLRSFRMTAPPFITNFTLSSSVISARGSPSTAMMSANFPASIDPTWSCQPINCGQTLVEDNIA